MEAENKANSALSQADAMVRKANPMKSFFPLIVILGAIIISFVVFYMVFGDYENFEGGPEAAKALETFVVDPNNPDIEAPCPTCGHPKNFFGIVFKGGFIIPFGMSVLLMLIIFVIERFITLFFLAGGRGSLDVFVQKVRMRLNANDLAGALEECDRQKGCVANVVRAGIHKYSEMLSNKELTHDQKKAAIQQSLEEATTLELPGLEKNLPIMATAASIGVLIGLLGTVVGMIKAFNQLAEEGTPDASKLSVGISEALVNTATGILSSTLAIIFYNFFTSRIDSLTYKIDEAGYSIVQNFETRHR